MAANVFGTPINDEFIEGLPDAPKVITPEVRAQYAMDYINDGGKNFDAQTYVENLKDQYGIGDSCLATFYNATGGTISFVTDHDYHGHIGPSPYPSRLENGQWGAFLHVHHTATPTGSSAAAVYNGKNADGDGRDWLMAWSIPFMGDNRTYSEVRAAGHYTSSVWGIISRNMSNSERTSEDTWDGCFSRATIGEGTSPNFSATFTLENITFQN
ncbi:23 kDa jasmonate-induced protein-like [Malania oleifera]|uniref:23 kDa jasmonate-induced protein-like n=1 Tax=Malania oleifera TaxID=397392 RepID=UPI0025ADE2B7|nr:23 kDa jasmonate-induced protein-like [Malania oleifera]